MNPNRCQACLDTFKDYDKRFDVRSPGSDEMLVCEGCVGWWPASEVRDVTPADVQARHEAYVEIADEMNQW